MLRGTSLGWLGVLLIALLSACKAYDSALLGTGQAHPMGGAGSGGAAGSSGAQAMEDGGADEDGGPCVMSAEACNLEDDDCDGRVDEDAARACEAIVLHAVTDCVLSMGAARCAKIRCLPGFEDCDGDPRNGCEETICACRPCPEEDGGVDDDAGS